jgi:hypothetical protein
VGIKLHFHWLCIHGTGMFVLASTDPHGVIEKELENSGEKLVNETHYKRDTHDCTPVQHTQHRHT